MKTSRSITCAPRSTSKSRAKNSSKSSRRLSPPIFRTHEDFGRQLAEGRIDCRVEIIKGLAVAVITPGSFPDGCPNRETPATGTMVDVTLPTSLVEKSKAQAARLGLPFNDYVLGLLGKDVGFRGVTREYQIELTENLMAEVRQLAGTCSSPWPTVSAFLEEAGRARVQEELAGIQWKAAAQSLAKLIDFALEGIFAEVELVEDDNQRNLLLMQLCKFQCVMETAKIASRHKPGMVDAFVEVTSKLTK